MRNRKRIEKFIPIAIKTIADVKIAQENIVPRPFNGYLASFGASIVQAGLRQSILFFSATDTRAQEDRAKVVKLVYSVLREAKEIPEQNEMDLSRYVNSTDPQDLGRKKEIILDAICACKMAIRSYKLE